MKTAQIQNMFFVLMMTLICGGISWLATMELRKENEVRQKEINHLKKQNAKDRDSLNTQLAITKDSLEVAFATIRQARIETQEAHERTQRLIKNYEKIIFVRYSNDHERDSVLSKLYPSSGVIR